MGPTIKVIKANNFPEMPICQPKWPILPNFSG